MPLSFIFVTLGIILIFFGIIWMIARPQSATTKIQISQHSIEVPTPGLLVMLLGVTLINIPAFKQLPKISIPSGELTQQEDGRKNKGRNNTDVSHSDENSQIIEESEPNNRISAAQRVELDDTVSGVVHTRDPTDIYRYKLPVGYYGPVRVVARGRQGSRRGALIPSADIEIYNDVEEQITFDAVRYDERTSLSANLTTDFYVIVKLRGDTTMLKYEVVAYK